jgi:hypothetical protein
VILAAEGPLQRRVGLVVGTVLGTLDRGLLTIRRRPEPVLGIGQAVSTGRGPILGRRPPIHRRPPILRHRRPVLRRRLPIRLRRPPIRGLQLPVDDRLLIPT